MLNGGVRDPADWFVAAVKHPQGSFCYGCAGAHLAYMRRPSAC